MPQPGTDSVLANLLTRRQKLSAARQKLGMEAPQRAGIQGNLRSLAPQAGPTPTKPAAAAPARAAAPAAPRQPARQAAPQAAPRQAAAPADDMRQRMLARATQFLGLVQQARRPQPRPDLAVPGRSRQMLAGGV